MTISLETYQIILDGWTAHQSIVQRTIVDLEFQIKTLRELREKDAKILKDTQEHRDRLHNEMEQWRTDFFLAKEYMTPKQIQKLHTQIQKNLDAKYGEDNS